MKQIVRRKKIIIPFDGYIRVKGIYGPVDIPYMETIENIGSMLAHRIPVYECLSNGKKLKLTFGNCDKDNDIDGQTTMRKTYEPVKPTKKSATIVVTDEDAELESKQNILRGSTKKMNTNASKEYEKAVDDVEITKSYTPNKIYVGTSNTDMENIEYK